ncbi:GAF domain-containing protein [Chondromyces apiculatus]|uniref:GAF domain protein n=1 Tax=Chondromyces apiculatus DSM 436 TaxID=1192034 RepID=A0A017SYA7_9BACT|nr:GAF domain-containing protein [Chondromyces apiculatus]EYF01565.1 GAF domain protein [Chondromyces apiculatus DSM 436]
MTDRKGRASDRPPDDLKKERDAFIQQFFRKGAQLTEELLRENERLRDKIAELEAENSKLRAHLASDSAIRDLLRKIEELEQEKRDLVTQSVRMVAASDRFNTRYADAEGELANLANLYVALSQLHSARSVRHVLRSLKELLAQFVGAGAFAVYFVSDEGNDLVAIASEGAPVADIERIPVTEGVIGDSFAKGEIYLKEGGDVSKGSVSDPAAVIPLGFDGRTIGAIAIFGTLPQKTEFVNVDTELFKLLGEQAAPALINARLFSDAGRHVPGVQAFLNLEE